MSDERALTIRQPYASLIVAGIKDVENRSWPVPSTLPQWRACSHLDWIRPGADYHCCADERDTGLFPFRLWVHAGKTHDHMACLRYAQAVWNEPTVFGAVLGTVLVTGCHKAYECLDASTSHLCSPWAEWRREDDPYRAYWHWTLADPQPLAEPIPMKGRQGLWRVPHNADGFLVGSSLSDAPSASTD